MPLLAMDRAQRLLAVGRALSVPAGSPAIARLHPMPEAPVERPPVVGLEHKQRSQA